MERLEISERLKAERIQERLKAERIQERLKAERIQERLAEVPDWSLDEGGRSLERTYEFPTIRAAALFVGLVTEIGEATGFVPEIDIRYLEVRLRVDTTQREGVTSLDFEIARIIDSRP